MTEFRYEPLNVVHSFLFPVKGKEPSTVVIPEVSSAFYKITDTIKSCLITPHLESTRKMIENYKNMYSIKEDDYSLKILGKLLDNKSKFINSLISHD